MTSTTVLQETTLDTRSDLQYYFPIYYHKQARLEKISNEADFLNVKAFEEDESEDSQI